MRLKKAWVRNYRSVRDSSEFAVDHHKTILVGPNEAGKTALLQAIQQINPPEGIRGFSALRDFPRDQYTELHKGGVKSEGTPVVTVQFELDDDDRSGLPESMRGVGYLVTRDLDNEHSHSLLNCPLAPKVSDVRKDLLRLAAHVDSRSTTPNPPETAQINAVLAGWTDDRKIGSKLAASALAWLDRVLARVDETNATEEQRFDKLRATFRRRLDRDEALKYLKDRTPKFVLFSNYHRVRPRIHLANLARRIASGSLDESQYDLGNICLLKLLGFTAQDLSQLGRVDEKGQLDTIADQLDERQYQLNAASLRLTTEIRRVWNPSPDRPEADRLRIVADGQYLKVVVEDSLGVEVELDQRSEGFQWLVSFFVVFFAEAEDQHKNAILLLDEPGLSLHGLKQREFRETLSRLAETNQTIYTTHSPFLVGPDELDLVRVVEMRDRPTGTKVHETITSTDPAALLPLQEALGYDLAQSLFAQKRNLVLEGLTDYWYLEAVSELLRAAELKGLNQKIALVPASSAGKVVYFATILHAHNLKVAALLDSDAAGDQAAKQETLVHTLGNKRILRTKDHAPTVTKAEIEDLLRHTLPKIARDELGIDVVDEVVAKPGQPLLSILDRQTGFSKYKLAKAFLKWSRQHEATDLDESERTAWAGLIGAINSALK